MASDTEGLFTFLFTDIEGSTRLWATEPEAMNEALARHDRLLSAAITDHGGQVFKTVGDAFCAAFTRAEDALAAALALQRAVRTEPWPPATPIRVRAALHSGPCICRDEDYFGPSLNRTARLLGVAAGGQTLLTAATRQAVGTLPDGASLRALGSVRLKDLAEPAQVFQLDGAGPPKEFPPLRSLDQLPSNLPSRAADFVGRAAAQLELVARIADTRVLTLVGPGGIGKTALALQVAAEILDTLPDGAWFVELAPVTASGDVADALATVLGLRDEPGRTLDETLAAWLKTRRLLLVLDNCEHLVSECARLSTLLLSASPGLSILATSREPLNVAGEGVWPVPPLAVGEEQAGAGEVATGEAVQLFVDRAQAAQPAFVLTAANAPAVAAICRRLDGIPLAIELAAARVRALPPELILARLDDRFRLLTGGRRDALPRQQTLRAAIDWSYELLSEAERLLLARLSVFRGDWSLEAAEAICADMALDALDVLDLVDRLVARSLVVPAGEGMAARFRLLETIRQYAREKLDLAGDGDALRTRHLDWYLDLARSGDAGLKSPDQGLWLDRLAAEHDDLAAAMDGAIAAGEVAEALRLGGHLWRFWYLRGHLGEGRRRLGAALALGEGAVAVDADLVNEATHGAATLAGFQGDYAAARALHLASLAARKAGGDQAGEAASLNNLGLIAYRQGDYVAARDLLQNSLELKRALGDRRGMANTLNNLAMVASLQVDFAAAERVYAECLDQYTALNDAAGIAEVLTNSASLAANRGDFEAARLRLAQSLTLCEAQGDTRRLANVRFLQAQLAYDEGRLVEARQLNEASRRAEERMGNGPGVTECQTQLGRIACAEGEIESARSLLEEALATFEAAGSRQGVADAACALGLVHRAAGDLPRAGELLRRGLLLSRALGQQLAVLYAIESLAGVALDEGRPDRTLALLSAAETIRRRLEAPAVPIAARQLAADRAAAWESLPSPQDAWASGSAWGLDEAVAQALA